MNRIHALAASAIIGLSAVFGVAATTKSTGISEPKPAASNVSDAAIAERQRKLNQAAKALKKARAQKPPALPAAPSSSVSASGARAPAPTRIVRTASAPARSFDDSHDDDSHDDDSDDSFEDDSHDD